MKEDFNGYIALHKKILDNPVLQDKTDFWIFIHILLKARWQTKTINEEGFQVGKGEFVYVHRTLADELQVHNERLHQALGLFVSEGMIEIFTNGKYKKIWVKNWDNYQTKK